MLIVGLAKVNARDDKQMTALHVAASKGHEAIVGLLAFNGVD
jgi:ankyrin repeat protein